ncbi:diguanylate cyclase, partial [bacterium]|nr:diguanylate cyclase [bacterium]
HLRDMYGYDSKEEIVETMIRLLKTETRSSDFLGRMADDRLLAVVPHTDAEGIDTMCERLLEAARQLEFISEGRRSGGRYGQHARPRALRRGRG